MTQYQARYQSQFTPTLLRGAAVLALTSASLAQNQTANAAQTPPNASAALASSGQANDAPAPAAPVSTAVPADANAAGNGDIVVTAQKRNELLHDVPISVAVLKADTLTASNQTRLQDYYATIAGFNVSPSPGSGGEQVISLRGLSTGYGTNPTVGVTIDGVAFGSSTSFAGNFIPDIDPSDLARIEVLRGPQGTLYGASSLGGLINFVTLDPQLDRTSGHVQAGLSSVDHGGAAGYEVRAGLNLPLSSDLAIRVSGFSRRDPGYIDNVISGRHDVNSANAYGGHVALLWQPVTNFSAKISGLIQDIDSHGASEETHVPGVSDYEQNYTPGVGASKKQIRAITGNLHADLDGVGLTSVSAYSVSRANNTWPLDPTDAVATYANTRKVSQELRANISLGHFADWMVAGYYADEKAAYNQDVPVLDANTGAVKSISFSGQYPGTYREWAVFSDLTVHLAKRFDVQIGARQSWVNQSLGAIQGVPPAAPTVTPTARFSYQPFTYLVTPTFKVTPNLMIYTRFASGFRAGGSNLFNPDPAVPRAYAPDKTYDYEAGIKGDLFDRRLSVEASAFHIRWSGVQINLNDASNNLTYTVNGGEATSDGFEVTLGVHPTSLLTLSATGSYTDAVLSENMPASSSVYGRKGDSLPYSSKTSGSFTVSQRIPLSSDIMGNVGGTLSYVGHRLGSFNSAPDRQSYPAYVAANLIAGVSYDEWRLNLYINNVADKRGELGGGIGTYPAYAFTYIQPRTIGFSVARDF